jgi:flagellar motor switch protein FliN/FliY
MANTPEETIESWRDFLDLPLQLSVEIGRTRMKTREILELAPSSIVKLSRSTGEGVEVYAANRPLVRGEIVAVEDRTGIRINEIITQEN